MIRIAIVDDEREILELLFRIIDDTLKREQAQFEITTFLKAEELLSSHREKPFQIIFADLEMPDVDGLHLAADDVVYFVSENHTIMMCEKENTKVQVMYTMEKLEKLLPQNQFVRCHAGYIVNCFYVFSINPNEILLTTGERIPLSRHRKKEMKSVFQQYLRGI